MVVVEDVNAARVPLESAGVHTTETDLNLDEIFEAYVIGTERSKPTEAAAIG